MRKIALLIFIAISCTFNGVQAQQIRITPEELNFRSVAVDSVVQLEFTLENLEEEANLIVTLDPANHENFSLQWSEERLEALRVMDAIYEVPIAIEEFNLDHGEDAISFDELIDQDYLRLPESVTINWDFVLIGSNPVTQIEAISTVEMPFGEGELILFDISHCMFWGFAIPMGDPREPLSVIAAIRDLDSAISQYIEDHGDEPISALTLIEEGYVDIPTWILRNWSFSMIGENPIRGIEAISLLGMPDGQGLAIQYDLSTEQFSGHRIPYQEFHNWMWRHSDLGRNWRASLTLSVLFRPENAHAYESEIVINVTRIGGEDVGILRIPVIGNGVLFVPEAGEAAPEKFIFQPAYPNPFNSTTTISYGLPHPGNVSLRLYNPLGQQVSTLFEGNRQAGIYSTNLTGSDLASGLYFVRLEASGQVFTQKVMLVR